MMQKIPVLILILFTISCGQNNSIDDHPQQEETMIDPEIAIQDSLWKEVMVIHDEVMPKMSDINKITRLLKEQLEENTQMNQATKDKINKTIEELNIADEAMWDWMHNLKQVKPLRDTMEHNDILQYLENEMIAITRVKDQMLASIGKGNDLLKQLEGSE